MASEKVSSGLSTPNNTLVLTQEILVSILRSLVVNEFSIFNLLYNIIIEVVSQLLANMNPIN